MKRLLGVFGIMVLLLAFCSPKAYADWVFCGQGGMVVKGANGSPGISGIAGIGQTLSSNITVLGSGLHYKTGEGISLTGGIAGISIYSQPFISKLKMGTFLTLGAGASDPSDGSAAFSELGNLGVYSQVNETTKIFLGLSFIHTGNSLDTWGVGIGTSINLIPATPAAKMGAKLKGK
jgi:hypothetical protein